MIGCSTERVRRFRERQDEAGRKRIALYLGPETLRKLDQLAGDQAQGAYLEKIVRTAIKREWSALATSQRNGQGQQCCDTRNPLAFPGRRRSFGGL